MKYTQPQRQYEVNVLTDSPYIESPSITITEMYFDYRKTDSWKCVIPSTVIYPKAKQLVKQYRKEYAKKLVNINA